MNKNLGTIVTGLLAASIWMSSNGNADDTVPEIDSTGVVVEYMYNILKHNNFVCYSNQCLDQVSGVSYIVAYNVYGEMYHYEGEL